MNGLLGSLIFTSPMILFALAGLPVLWFLLRVMPPRPRVIVLPSVRFLEGLTPERTSPSHTPWWILLLRLLLLAFVILGLSGPVLNPSAALEAKENLTIVLDNGWSAAPVWDRQLREAENLIAQAERQNLSVTILPTAALPEGPAEPIQPLPAAQALSTLKGLTPKAWNTDYPGLIERLSALPPGARDPVYWLSDGLEHRGFSALADNLAGTASAVRLSLPPPESLALGLRVRHTLSGPEIEIERPEGISPARPVSVQALASDGRVIGFQNVTLEGGDEAPVFFDLAESLRGDVSQYRIAGQTGAASVFLLDESYQRRSVGVAAPAEKSDRAPLIEASYYLRRALEPYADLAFDTPEKLAAQGRSMIILPDVAAMTLPDLNALETWVDKGGLLLRFAGPATAENVRNLPLTPVPLRGGGRALDGSLTWDTPLKIKEFLPDSPFIGLEIPKDISIRQQVLADPSDSLEGKVWAVLEDGTPLITAAPYGKGMLVMVHTSAGPEWSDFPLSGLFVDVLRRLAALSAAPSAALSDKSKDGMLDPLLVLDGFGAARKADASVKPIKASDLQSLSGPTPENPPGLYGRAGLQAALNIAGSDLSLKALSDIPAPLQAARYGERYEMNLMPLLLAAAALLALLDWLIMSLLNFGLRRSFARRFTAFVLMMGVMASAPARADDLEYANSLYLAYVKTGDAGVDGQSQQGLENLARTLEARTSAEPKGVAAIDIETDALVFFPWLYWPVSAGQTPPSPQALQKIQAYLDRGGTILFDLRFGAGQDMDSNAALQNITASLNIPPLHPIPEDHVLTKTFYLMQSFPGLHTTGTLWVEKGAVKGRDGVSSVIIGSNDWAAAWAAEGSSGGLPGGSRQGEMAMRFGVNVMMYALSGNYKADQVHVPFILERLER